MATGVAAAALLGPPPRPRRLSLQASLLSPVNIISSSSAYSQSPASSPTVPSFLGVAPSRSLLPPRLVPLGCSVGSQSKFQDPHDTAASRSICRVLPQGAEEMQRLEGTGDVQEVVCNDSMEWQSGEAMGEVLPSQGLSRRSALLIVAGGVAGSEAAAAWLPLGASGSFPPPLDTALAAEADSSGDGQQGIPDGARQRNSRVERERERPRAVLLDEGVQIITFREGGGVAPQAGNVAVVHYTGRLGAKQGWRFDSTFDHKDAYGGPEPFEFVVGSPKVIKGLSIAVSSMKAGGIARAIIPPPAAYQSTEDEPLPPNFFDRQRLFTTVFNPTRLRNGEQDTLGTIVFDIQLLSVRVPAPVPQG